RGRQAHAAAGGEAEHPGGRGQEGGGQGQAAGGQDRGCSQGEEIAPAGRSRAMAAAIMSADEGKPRRLRDEERKLWGHFTRSVAPLRRPPVPADPLPPPAAPTKAKSATHARPPAPPPLPPPTPAPCPTPFH